MPLRIEGNLRTLGNSLRTVADNAENVEPAWEAFSVYLGNQVSRQFSSRGTHFGTPWKPLTPDYARAKRKAGYRGGILVREGDLRDSFSSPRNILDSDRDSAVFGSRLDTAVWHQYGTRRNGKQVNPPRPMLVKTEKMENYLRRLVTQHLERGLK